MQDFVFCFFLNIVSLFAVFEAKPIWQHARKNIKKRGKKNKKKQHGKIYTLASKKKGQHKFRGESSSIKEAEETRIWTMYLNATPTCFRGTMMDKWQEGIRTSFSLTSQGSTVQYGLLSFLERLSWTFRRFIPI